MHSRRPSFALALALAAGTVSCSRAPRPSILLLTLDTTRADALSCYSSDGAPTTNLDRLAEGGIAFDAAFSCVPMTFPAHASILTGLYPPRHRVRDNGGAPLADAALTLAERAQAEGYATAAFVAAVVLDPVFGLDQGFSVYDGPEGDPAAGSEHGEGQRPASEVVDGALAWLETRDPAEPFLLWLHFYDPHTPYAAPEDGGCALGDLDASLRSQYLRDVCAMDREIGRVLAALDDGGLADETIVLAVGDHGEAFGEHSEYGHSAHCFDTTLRVPFLLRLPDGSHAGERRGDVVSLVDVLPTLARLAGWSDPAAPPIGALADLDGRALLPGPMPTDRGVYFESYYGYLNFGWSPLAGWLDGNGKYLHASRDEFYRLDEDPNEERNRIGEPGLDLHPYQVPIARLGEASRLPAGDSAPQDPELLASLRGLGYLSSGASTADLPAPLASSSLPAPSDMAAPYERSIDALELIRRGESAAAIPILEEVRSLNPANPFVLDLLASCYLEEGRAADAEPVLRDLIRSSRTPDAGAFTRLGVTLLALGRPGEAVEVLGKATQLAPDRPRPKRELARARSMLGR
ncbi:MAG TPA: tetratricopeptide repeat protein [Planctomycetes bacterium]|nr:tetratricopeptide repeat protein [Planctomycetota bacterium]